MVLRSAELLFPGVALPLMIASRSAHAGRSDDVTSIGGAPHEVELVHGFEENKPSGAFTLTIRR